MLFNLIFGKHGKKFPSWFVNLLLIYPLNNAAILHDSSFYVEILKFEIRFDNNVIHHTEKMT